MPPMPTSTPATRSPAPALNWRRRRRRWRKAATTRRATLAVAAAADADLAYALSNAATTRAEYAQRRAEIVELQQRLQLQAEVPGGSPLDIPPRRPARQHDPAASQPAAGAGSGSAPERLRRLRAPARAPGAGRGLAIRSAKPRDRSRCSGPAGGSRSPNWPHAPRPRVARSIGCSASAANCWSKPAARRPNAPARKPSACGCRRRSRPRRRSACAGGRSRGRGATAGRGRDPRRRWRGSRQAQGARANGCGAGPAGG